jgi:putative CocE/NonD family hydrolase
MPSARLNLPRLPENVRHIASVFALVLSLVATVATPAWAQRRKTTTEKRTTSDKPAYNVKSHYTKFEYQIPMRDGVKLFTAIYIPKTRSQKYPILLTRTPYSCRPYGTDQYNGHIGPSELFEKSGYIFVEQDVRGRFMSEGTFVNMRPYIENKNGSTDVDESSDTYDTIDWLIKHVPNNNGRVGMWGISYPGFYTAAGMIDAHPALVAASPQAPVTDWFMGDDWHHNGALQIAHMISFLPWFDRPRPKPVKEYGAKFDFGTPDGYNFFLHMGPLSKASDRYFKGETAFLKEVCQHANYDEWWKARNLRPHLKHIKPAVLTVGGWYDAENLFGALEVYRNLAKNSPSTDSHLVMGPWVHGGWYRGEGSRLGDVTFNTPTAEYYQSKIEFPFFEHHLKHTGKFEEAKTWIFETGGNTWHKFETWPPPEAEARSYYFVADGGLSTTAPTEKSADESDEYVSDPSHPVPFLEMIGTGMTREYMTADQRFASRRPDVLDYETEPLAQDVSVVGPVSVDINVSTSGTDSDWVVKLVDVYPNNAPDPKLNPSGTHMGGYEQLVRGDAFRGKYRNSFEKPEAFEPGKPAEIKFKMQDICHTFRTGHRIMVQVQSSWFPLIDRNPQSFVDIYSADPSTYHKATERVYRSHDRASRVTLMVMPSLSGTGTVSR